MNKNSDSRSIAAWIFNALVVVMVYLWYASNFASTFTFMLPAWLVVTLFISGTVALIWFIILVLSRSDTYNVSSLLLFGLSTYFFVEWIVLKFPVNPMIPIASWFIISLFAISIVILVFIFVVLIIGRATIVRSSKRRHRRN